jgi:hypothetical protein
MRTPILTLATIATVALAAPHGGGHHNHPNTVWDIKTITHTVWVTEGYQPTIVHERHSTSKAKSPASVTTHHHSKPTSSAVQTHSSFVVISHIPIISKPTSVHKTATPPPASVYHPSSLTLSANPPPSPTSSSTTSPSASPSASSYPSSPSDGSPLSGGVSVLSTCNKFRDMYNLKGFKWSTQLASNAGKTGRLNNGVTENHSLFEGSFAQVITPGLNSDISGVNLQGFTPFEMAYLSWMCEVSSDSQISKMCPNMQSSMHMEYSETGHYDILTSASYSSIGCTFTHNPNAASNSPYQGLWICDFAF